MGNGKRILHLMPDEKFIDYFIDQSEDIAPGESEYWILVRSESDTLKYVKSTGVKKIRWPSNFSSTIEREVKKFNKLILHSFYAPEILWLIKRINKDVKIYWIFWGSDGYSFTPNFQRWLMPKTRMIKRKLLLEDIGLLKSIYRSLLEYRYRLRLAISTRKLFKHIDTCLTWIEFDFEMIRFVNPQMKYAYYSYFSIEQLQLEKISIKRPNLNSLWLGNSATATNNHLDALYYLKKINWTGKIVTPLSYGDDRYREEIIKEGRALFKENFEPITQFLPIDKYHEKMQQSGIYWMNHIRQQAAGNTLAALYMGKLVILNPENNMAKTLVKWGIKVANKNILLNLDSVNNQELSLNRDILIEKIKKRNSLETIAQIYL